MIAHLEWHYTEAVTGSVALGHWDAAYTAGVDSGKILGGPRYCESIIRYTKCHITKRLEINQLKVQYWNEAMVHYQTTGRQFQHLALFNIWFDFVREWNKDLDLISDLNYDDYMREKRKSNFPFSIDSIRLCR
jgi:hypothetical protein